MADIFKNFEEGIISSKELNEEGKIFILKN